MTLTDLLQDLTAADIRLWVENGQLRYSAPAGAMSAQRRVWITTHKTELVDFLAQAGRTAIHPAPPGTPLQLSCAQERLWLTQQLEGDSGLYNEGRALCIRGPLNTTVLQAALQHIVQRHEALRSCFPEVQGRPRLKVVPQVSVRLCSSDLSQLPLSDEQRQQQALEWLSAESQRPFDLSQAPLVRFPLVRIAPEAYALGVFMHHLICDGLSLNVLFTELSQTYAALCRGEAPNLPVLPIQYSDFAHWQRGQADSLAPQRDLQYWRRQLRRIQPMRLGDHLNEQRSSKGQVHRFELLPELVRGMDHVARQQGVSRFTAFSAAYQVLLSACAGRNDVHFSIPVTERQHSELHGLIGLFVNSLNVRQDIPGALGFNTLLSHTRATMNNAYAHQQAPFERVVDAVAADAGDRHAATLALSQARLVYLEAVARRFDFHDLQVEPFAVARRLAKFELMLTLERDAADADAPCQCDFEYRSDVFSEAYITQLASQWVQLLETVVARPHTAVSELRETVQRNLAAWRRVSDEPRRSERRTSLRVLRRRAAG